MLQRRRIGGAALGVLGMVASTASADYIGAVQIGYWVTAADFGGAEVSVYVVDVYMLSDDTADTLLNVYNWNTVAGAPASYFQSFTGTGWTPTNLGGPFDTAALQSADSFVTIGGFGADALQTPGAGAGSGLDPNFGGNNAAAPGVDAGWYNGSPPSLNGAVMTYDSGVTGTLIGRFTSLDGEFSLEGTTFEATWNQGLGTPGQQAGFVVVDVKAGLDCNANGIPDLEDLDSGTSLDCNSNLRPDECDIADGTASDCNLNGVPDECEVDAGTQTDCNTNGILDSCELAEGLASDYNGNGLPDLCEALLVPGDYESIAEAIQNAPEDSVIFVDAGSYEEPVILNRALVLVAPNGPGLTKLDGSKRLGPVVMVDDAPAGALLAGFTIKAGDPSGSHPMGGGIVGRDSYATIADCVIVGNTGMEGGGVRFAGGSPTIVSCEIRGNLSYGVGGGLFAEEGDILVSDTVFEANIALAGRGHAIGVVNGSMAAIDACSITQHAAEGAVVLTASSSTTKPMALVAVETTLTDNAGIALETEQTIVELTDCIIEGNGQDGLRLAAGTLHRIMGTRIRDNGGIGLVTDTGIDGFDLIGDNTICGNANGAVAGIDPTALFGSGNVVFDDRCPDLVVPDDADTIQLAIDAAIDGERIGVRPGDWDGFDPVGKDIEVIATEGLDVTTTQRIAASSGEPSTMLVRGFTIGSRTGLGPTAAVLLVDANLTIDACRVTGGSDSGVQVSSGMPTIRDSTIDGNESPQFGGGVRVAGGSLTLDRVTVAANSIPLVAGSRGGGVFVESGAELVLIESSICDNARENLANFGTVSDQGGNTVCLAFDCDGNGLEDAADIEDLGRPDCNDNLVPDDCDIAAKASADCDDNGVPDECQLGDGSAFDLNLNGVIDACEDELVFSVPGIFGTIGDAIAAAPNGAVVELAAGTFNESVDFGDSRLVIRGSLDAPESVVLDGTGLPRSVVLIAGGQGPESGLQGLTIANGTIGTPFESDPTIVVGGGLFIDQAAPTIQGVIFRDNRSGYGGGAYARGGAPTFIDCTFVGNTASTDGGGLQVINSTASVNGASFTGNTATNHGGAVKVVRGDAEIVDSTMTGNGAAEGGGVYFFSDSSTTPLPVTSTVVSSNHATTTGGGLRARPGQPGFELFDSVVCDNTPDDLIGLYIDLGDNELCVCPSDLSGNGLVGAEDVGILLSQWGDCPTACTADFNGDGQVNAGDLGPLLGAWGVCP